MSPMEEDEGGVLRVTEDQQWLDNIESWVRAIAAAMPQIDAYLKLISETEYLEPNTTLVAMRDRLTNIRSILTDIRTTTNTMLSRTPALIDGRVPVTDYLDSELKTQRIKLVAGIVTPLPASPLANRRVLVVYNTSDDTIYWGGSNVTGGIGMPLLPGQPITFNARPGFQVYATIPTGESSKNVVIAEAR